MLFNSVEFITWFLPVSLLGTYVLSSKVKPSAAIAFLIVASAFFYAWHRPSDLLILGTSILLNFLAGSLIGHLQQREESFYARAVITLSVSANLGLIGYFKYSDFLISSVTTTYPYSAAIDAAALPLGISFFTFQQIKFLVDRYKGHTPQPAFSKYCLFIIFFPHVIAGPIVHHNVLIPQFERGALGSASISSFMDGLSFFLLGLAKKVAFADQFGVWADIGFNGAAQGHELTTYAAWGATLSYTLQLYFDFSGYSDMAFGIARMFGLNFPMNFDSPYQATSIIDFWRRWHMTLSQFLRDHVYIPLGGNRHGTVRRHVNIFATMAIGGLWHGAGLTFILWGALHGLYLIINHLFNDLIEFLGLPHEGGRLRRICGCALTLLATIFAWVLFRADSVSSATSIMAGMLGFHGSLLPDQILSIAPPLRRIAQGVGQVPYLADQTVMGTLEMGCMMAIGYAVVLFMPNLYRVSFNIRLLLMVPSFAFTVQRVFFTNIESSFLYFRF